MIPSKLRDLVAFSDGNVFLGEVASLTPPKIVRKVEEWIGGGMSAPIQLAYDIEALKAEFTIKGRSGLALAQMGITGVTGTGLRFVGAYDRDDTSQVGRTEWLMRGRHDELDPGEMKRGESGETKVVSNLAYVRCEVDGRIVLEIDAINGTCIIGGIDQRAGINEALGI